MSSQMDLFGWAKAKAKQSRQEKRTYVWLTSRQLNEIRSMIDAGVSVPMIAAIMDKDPSHIHKIKLGRIHRDGTQARELHANETRPDDAEAAA
jgi:hypothetical protein